MRRTALLVTGAIAFGLLAFSGTAAANGGLTTCTTHSKNVVGHAVHGALTSSGVNPAHAKFASCGHAKQVMDSVLNIRLKEPRRVLAFHCEPTVLAASPDLVRYSCIFQGTDSAEHIKLAFKVTYNLD